MQDHALYSPSSAAAWMRCDAYARINADNPSPQTPESERGVRLHKAAAELYIAQSCGDDGADVLSALDPDDAHAVASAVALVPERYRVSWIVERRLTDPASPDFFGTPDAYAACRSDAYNPSSVSVIDYKFGHRVVDVFENWQLLCYAMLVDPDADEYELKIIQPGAYGYPALRSWRISGRIASEYFERIEQRLDELRKLARDATAVLRAETGEHCRYCPGRLTCSAHLTSICDLIDVSDAYVECHQSAEQMSARYRLLHAVVARISGELDVLEGALLQLGRDGAELPWLAVEHKAGALKWTGDVEQVRMIGSLLGADLTKTVAITPTQAKKKIGDDIVSRFSERAPGKAVLKIKTPRDISRIFGAS